MRSNYLGAFRSEEHETRDAILRGVAYLIAFSINSLMLMILWNWVIVDIFKAAKIDYWYALGFTLLLEILQNPIISEIRRKDET